MRYPLPLVEGRFLRRYKRFLCDVVLPDGSQATAHLANTGSMRNCTEPGAAVRLLDSRNPRRKLQWSVEQICVGGHWICVNTSRPNAVVAEAIAASVVPELAGYPSVRREVTHGASRFDLLLEGQGRCWVEVKNTTLLRGDRLSFPDARTARGTKHLSELAALADAGDRAVLFLHVGHEGGRLVEPARDIDPHFAQALEHAVHAGVQVLAWRSRMDLGEIALAEPVPFQLV